MPAPVTRISFTVESIYHTLYTSLSLWVFLSEQFQFGQLDAQICGLWRSKDVYCAGQRSQILETVDPRRLLYVVIGAAEMGRGGGGGVRDGKGRVNNNALYQCKYNITITIRLVILLQIGGGQSGSEVGTECNKALTIVGHS